MVPCPDKLTTDELYESLLPIPTSLGSPRLAYIRGFSKPVIVYGSDSDTCIYAVYRARLFDYFYINAMYSFNLKGFLSEDEELEEEFAFYLDEIASVVEAAME